MAINIPIITEFADQGLKSAQGAFQNFRREVANAEGAIGKFKAGTGAAFDAVKANAGAFAIAGGAAIAAFGAKAISAASDFEESTAKISQIFGNASDAVFDFAEDAAQALGQSKQSVLDAAGIFGTFGKAAGLAGKDLSTFSNDFTALASDLASFNNTSPEEAVQALGAALRGESEPLRRYGILLDDASMRQKALELGITSTTKNALTPQQKILAAQALIFQQSSDAQGDFARTSDGLANQQRILKAELSNVTVEIGQKLLPAATTFAQFANDNLVPVVLKAAEAFGTFSDAVENSASQAEKLPGPLQNSGRQAFFFIDIAGSLLRSLNLVSDSFGRATEKTIDLELAWKDGYRQMIIAANGMKELEEATSDLSVEWERFLGVLTADDAWNSLLDKFDRTKEAAYDALVDGSAASARRAQKAQNDLNREIAKYIDEIGTIPDEVQTRIIALLEREKFDEALGILNQLRAGVNVPITGTVSGIAVPAGQTPSETTGRGTFTPPSMPGVPSTIGGVPVRIPSIGAYSGGVTVNVAGSVISENDLVETVRKGLVNSQRNGAGLVYSNR